MARTDAGELIQVVLAVAFLVGALVLTQVKSLSGSDIATAVEQKRTAETYTVRLEQAEMLMQTGCIEAGTY